MVLPSEQVEVTLAEAAFIHEVIGDPHSGLEWDHRLMRKGGCLVDLGHQQLGLLVVGLLHTSH